MEKLPNLFYFLTVFGSQHPSILNNKKILEVKHMDIIGTLSLRYSQFPILVNSDSLSSELILCSSIKTADFLSLPFVGDDQDSEKSKPAGSDGERRGVKRQRDEKDEHGRAYYEFREEAYHSR